MPQFSIKVHPRPLDDLLSSGQQEISLRRWRYLIRACHMANAVVFRIPFRSPSAEVAQRVAIGSFFAALATIEASARPESFRMSLIVAKTSGLLGDIKFEILEHVENTAPGSLS